jgi:hypothetical protein
LDEAAAAFSSNSGERTLEYNMICQCKKNILLRFYHTIKSSNTMICTSIILKVIMTWRVSYEVLHPMIASSKFAVCDENFELPEMAVALSCAYVWKFHYVLNLKGLIV